MSFAKEILLDVKTRRSLIEKYKEGYQKVVKALENITEAELEARLH